MYSVREVHHLQSRTAYPYWVHEFTTVKEELLTLTEYMSSPPSKENCLPLLSTWVHHHQRRTAYPYWVHQFTTVKGELLTLTEYMSSPPSNKNCLPLLSTWVHHRQRRTAYPYWVHELTTIKGELLTLTLWQWLTHVLSKGKQFFFDGGELMYAVRVSSSPLMVVNTCTQ
jgi:hypothetical protein